MLRRGGEAGILRANHEIDTGETTVSDVSTGRNLPAVRVAGFPGAREVWPFQMELFQNHKEPTEKKFPQNFAAPFFGWRV
jgi:hypothetical protein